jgi:hypothetical protein
MRVPSGDIVDEIVCRTDAKPEHARLVLAHRDDIPDGRSQFQWFRLANGDLILGVFPQGDLYEMLCNGADPIGI